MEDEGVGAEVAAVWVDGREMRIDRRGLEG